MNKELKRIFLYPQLKCLMKEIEETANIIKALEATNDQEVINYEDFLNKFSNIDYNTI